MGPIGGPLIVTRDEDILARFGQVFLSVGDLRQHEHVSN